MRLLVAACCMALLAGCGNDRPEEATTGDHWVVVTYPVLEGDPAMMVLLDTETAADEALQDAGAGVIDGNEVGQGVYDMYFVGADRQAMWDVLEPILDDGDVAWTKAELRDGLDDPTPIVIDGA